MFKCVIYRSESFSSFVMCVLIFKIPESYKRTCNDNRATYTRQNKLRLILFHLNDPIVQIQIQNAINLIIMSKEFLHMRSSKSQEFWLPVTNYP